MTEQYSELFQKPQSFTIINIHQKLTCESVAQESKHNPLATASEISKYFPVNWT